MGKWLMVMVGALLVGCGSSFESAEDSGVASAETLVPEAPKQIDAGAKAVKAADPPDAGAERSHEATDASAASVADGATEASVEAPSPPSLGPYTGADAGNGCIVIESNWCADVPSPSPVAYVCPAGSAPAVEVVPGECVLVTTPATGLAGYCCI
jgi:hypothetical protein